MASKFCSTVTYNQINKEAKFQAGNGDEYLVKFSSNFRRDLILNIQWNSISHVALLAEVYTSDFKNCIASKGKVVKNTRTCLTLCDAFNTCSNLNYQYRCLISVIPYTEIQDVPHSAKSSSSLKTKPWPVTEMRHENLAFDMQSLLTRSDLSDVIVTDGSTEIMAHKLVLSARSPVFDKMFQHNLRENLENRIVISDVSAEVLKAMINFIYTGVIEIKDSQMAQELYLISDRYDVQDLRSVCSSLMKKNVTLDNVLDTFVVASLSEDSDVKKAAMEFIVINFASVKAHESWNRFVTEQSRFVVEILNFVMDKKL